MCPVGSQYDSCEAIFSASMWFRSRLLAIENVVCEAIYTNKNRTTRVTQGAGSNASLNPSTDHLIILRRSRQRVVWECAVHDTVHNRTVKPYSSNMYEVSGTNTVPQEYRIRDGIQNLKYWEGERPGEK